MTNTIDPISYNAGIEAAKKHIQAMFEGPLITKGVKAYIHDALCSLQRPEPQTAPDTSEVPTRYKPGDIVVRDGIVRRFIEAEIEGEKWEILGTLAPYVHPDHAAPAADAERLALDDGALLNRLKTEAQLAKNGGHPILERSFNLAIDEIKKLREAAKGQLVVVNVAIAERQRAERNRDMWKGQCERQAEKLTALRAGGWREDMQS